MVQEVLKEVQASMFLLTIHSVLFYPANSESSKREIVNIRILIVTCRHTCNVKRSHIESCHAIENLLYCFEGLASQTSANNLGNLHERLYWDTLSTTINICV